MARKPLPRKHISSLGGLAVARKHGSEYMAELARKGHEARRARLGEAGYHEAMKRMSLRAHGYDVAVEPSASDEVTA